jgi:phage baseplate assembly protein W
LGKPSFGCIIQDLVFEQITDELQYEVKDEVRRIVKNDPRWSLEMLNVEVDDHTIICNLNLLYIKTSTLAQLYLKFTSEEI